MPRVNKQTIINCSTGEVREVDCSPLDIALLAELEKQPNVVVEYLKFREEQFTTIRSLTTPIVEKFKAILHLLGG